MGFWGRRVKTVRVQLWLHIWDVLINAGEDALQTFQLLLVLADLLLQFTALHLVELGWEENIEVALNTGIALILVWRLLLEGVAHN